MAKIGAMRLTVRLSGEASDVLRQLGRLRDKTVVERIDLQVVIPDGRPPSPVLRAVPGIEHGEVDQALADMRHYDWLLPAGREDRLRQIIQGFGRVTAERHRARLRHVRVVAREVLGEQAEAWLGTRVQDLRTDWGYHRVLLDLEGLAQRRRDARAADRHGSDRGSGSQQ